MRWRGRRQSSNIEDRRGSTRGPFRLPGGFGRGGFGRGGFGRGGQGRGGGLPRGVRRGGLGGLGLIIVVLAALFFGIDPGVLLQGTGTGLPPAGAPQGQVSEEQQELAEFVSVVLADTEDTWHALFQQSGESYREPTLVLFTGAVNSACGYAQAAVGPFYCPADQKVYIDLGFYRDLKQRFGAPGDFAQAYVIAHEVAHHVQTLMGISERVQALRQQVSATESNALSVRMELQADCLAGLWAHHADRQRQILEPGDLEEALNAASAIGDDRLQRQAGGAVVPDSFTHGSSEQRVRWFKRGFETGGLEACDTFGADRL
ncbi:MAG: neutral zinc metallopeptidase [Kiloniellales bacterium]|nr:neutral zinc metallopeptidase [Kiloniellales bacterium]